MPRRLRGLRTARGPAAIGRLDRYFRQYIEAQTGDEEVFSWQGGQPTHHKVMAAARLLRRRDLQVNDALIELPRIYLGCQQALEAQFKKDGSEMTNEQIESELEHFSGRG